MLKKSDPQIYELIKQEEKRQAEVLELIASENYVSDAVLEALGSVMTNKYAEGYPRRRYYAGNSVIDQVEELAVERVRKTFVLPIDWHVNVQPHSGSPANLAVYSALLENGDKILSLDLARDRLYCRDGTSLLFFYRSWLGMCDQSLLVCPGCARCEFIGVFSQCSRY